MVNIITFSVYKSSSVNALFSCIIYVLEKVTNSFAFENNLFFFMIIIYRKCIVVLNLRKDSLIALLTSAAAWKTEHEFVVIVDMGKNIVTVRIFASLHCFAYIRLLEITLCIGFGDQWSYVLKIHFSPGLSVYFRAGGNTVKVKVRIMFTVNSSYALKL